MDERMREAFAQVRAEEELKQRTLACLARETGGWRAAPRRRVRPMLTAAACAACLLLTLGSLWLYFTPAAYISVDVNPSLELTVNRFDRVIAVEGRNDDGAALAESLHVRFLNYAQALEQVLDSPSIADCLAREETVSITVAGDDEARTETMLAQVSACAAERGTAYCHAASLSTAEAAHEQDLSCGKYQMLLALQARDPTVTAEDVREMTMAQLRAWLAELEGGAGTSTSPQQEQAGSGQNGSGQAGGGQGQAGQGQAESSQAPAGSGQGTGHHQHGSHHGA